jgi:tetratricopeptide (TPR) repeat protein
MKVSSLAGQGDGHALRRDRALLIVLGALIVVWLATWPLRTRLAREAARNEREAALQTQAQQAIQQISAAEAAARQRVEQSPQDLQARLALADVLAQQHKYAEAAEALQAAEAIDPRSPLPHHALGDLYSVLKMPDLAMIELQSALQRDPNDVRALSLLAFDYVSYGWNRQARDLLTRALRAAPNDAHLHTALALANFQDGNAREAEQHLLIARSLTPDDPGVLGPLIEVYRHSQRYPEALKLIDQAMPTALDKTFLHLEQAQVYLEMQNGPAALRAADQALQNAPNDIHVLYLRGQAQKMVGQTDAATRSLEQVSAVDPHFEQTELLLGQLYTQHGQREKGTAMTVDYNKRRAQLDDVARDMLGVAEHPADPQAHLRLGRYYRQIGQTPRAIVELKRTLELSPRNAEARGLLAECLRQAHRTAEADALAVNH